MSGFPTHLEGYGDPENVCSINGPKVRQGVMRGTEFREENAGKKQKNKCLAPFFVWAK